MSPTRQPNGLDWFMMILLAAVWGASFIMIKRSVAIFDPMQMAMWRMVLATVVYLPIAAAYWSKIDWKRWKPLLVVAFCGSAIPNFLFAIAQQHVNSSLAGVLNTLTPLFTVIIGASFFQMKVTWARALGILVGLAGAVLLVLFNSGATASGNVFFCGTVCACHGLLCRECQHGGALSFRPASGGHCLFGICNHGWIVCGGPLVLRWLGGRLGKPEWTERIGIYILPGGYRNGGWFYPVLLADAAHESCFCHIGHLFVARVGYCARRFGWRGSIAA